MFRASLTSILSVPHVIRPFNSLEEFISSEYRLYTVAGDSHVERLREKDSGTLNRLWSAKIAADPDSRLLPTVADGVDKVLERDQNGDYPYSNYLWPRDYDITCFPLKANANSIL